MKCPICGNDKSIDSQVLADTVHVCTTCGGMFGIVSEDTFNMLVKRPPMYHQKFEDGGSLTIQVRLSDQTVDQLFHFTLRPGMVQIRGWVNRSGEAVRIV